MAQVSRDTWKTLLKPANIPAALSRCSFTHQNTGMFSAVPLEVHPLPITDLSCHWAELTTSCHSHSAPVQGLLLVLTLLELQVKGLNGFSSQC